MASESMILANASILFPPPPPSSTSEDHAPSTFEIVYACSPAAKSWGSVPRWSALLVRRNGDGSSELLLRGSETYSGVIRVDGPHDILRGLLAVTAMEIGKKFRPLAVPMVATDDGWTDVSPEESEGYKDTPQRPPRYSKQATVHHPHRTCVLLEPARFFFPREFQSIEEMLEAVAERKRDRRINGPHFFFEPPEAAGSWQYFPGREELVEEFAVNGAVVEE